MYQTNQEIMQRFVGEVINNRCLGVIEEIIHPDYVYRTPGEELHGRQALRDLFAAYNVAFPDLCVSIDDQVYTDDKAVVLFTLTATHENDFMGIGATGKPVNINGMICSRIENGQIIEEWELLDQLNLFRQLGIVSI